MDRGCSSPEEALKRGQELAEIARVKRQEKQAKEDEENRKREAAKEARRKQQEERDNAILATDPIGTFLQKVKKQIEEEESAQQTVYRFISEQNTNSPIIAEEQFPGGSWGFIGDMDENCGMHLQFESVPKKSYILGIEKGPLKGYSLQLYQWSIFVIVERIHLLKLRLLQPGIMGMIKRFF